MPYKNPKQRAAIAISMKKAGKTPKDTTNVSGKGGSRFNKGGMPTKKRIGTNDYRKGGYVLSSVDNRKNKRK